jgi:hypothetical protein
MGLVARKGWKSWGLSFLHVIKEKRFRFYTIWRKVSDVNEINSEGWFTNGWITKFLEQQVKLIG